MHNVHLRRARIDMTHSINKGSETFEGPSDSGDSGSKRTVRWLMQSLREQGHDTEKLWGKMADVIIKTLIVALPHNQHL